MSISVGLAKKCPYCGEAIPADARKCSACGALMPDASVHAASTPSTQTVPAQGAPADAQARAAFNADALRVVHSEGKIPAIKFVRVKTGLGLKQAKEYVEAVEAGRDPGPVQVMAAKGCGTAALIVGALMTGAVLLRVFLS